MSRQSDYLINTFAYYSIYLFSSFQLKLLELYNIYLLKYERDINKYLGRNTNTNNIQSDVVVYNTRNNESNQIQTTILYPKPHQNDKYYNHVISCIVNIAGTDYNMPLVTNEYNLCTPGNVITIKFINWYMTIIYPYIIDEFNKCTITIIDDTSSIFTCNENQQIRFTKTELIIEECI